MNYLAKFIGHNIQQCRRKRGISQKQLAIGIMKSRASVANYETGNTIPPLNVLYQIAHFCGFSLDKIAWSTMPTLEELKEITKPEFKNCRYCKGKGEVKA